MAMVACRVLSAVLLLGLYSTSTVTGVTLNLRDDPIPTDGSGRIVITDINPDGDNNEDALLCQSELAISDGGNWFLHPTQLTTDDSDRIEATDSRGWRRNRDITMTNSRERHRLVRLRRVDSVASGGRALEGVFTCDIPGDTNTPVSVGIYYPISAVDVTINVESSRQGTFTVTCTARGGTVVSSSLTGPGGVDLALQPVGSTGRTGQNTYSVTSGILSGRSNGDTYQCTAAANLSSPHLSDSAVLSVATDPIDVSLAQVSATTVRVEWSQPSGGASVTGYVVHYSSNGVTNSISGLPSTSTSHDITGLTSGGTYSISVEATSEHLYGESENETITLYGEGGADKGSNVGSIVGGSIAAIIAVLAIVGIAVVVVCVVRKRRGSSEKSSYKPSSEATGLPLVPVHYEELSQNITPSGETNMAEPMIAMFPEDKHAVEGQTVLLTVSVEVQSQPSPNVAKTQQIQLSAIAIDDFGDFVAQSHASNNSDFRDQYTEVDKDAGLSVSIGFSPKYKRLNRFANITVYNENRIILRPIEGHSDCQRDFINACYVDGYKCRNKFIAAQGPMPKTLVDFWRLVWQEKPPSIVMVTNLVEGTKTKCQQYWPDAGTESFGPFQVTITDQQILADYTTRSLLVQLTGSSERVLKVTQFHFTAWPDHGVPEYATPILAFHKKIKKHHKPSKGAILVHCSAGVGRTGTLITIDRVLDQIQQEKVVDIAGTVRHLRSQRMKMVQNPEQYIFIHDAILEAVTCGDTQISASDLRRNIHKLCQRNPDTRLTGFEGQFKVLEQVSPNPSEVKCDIALQNPTRNRSEEFVPADRWRVVLEGEVEDYIHAVVVNGYKQQRAFIIAQGPMQSTARDFWKMIHDWKCGVVVMLSDLVEAGEEVCYQYWPTSGIVNIGEYRIDLLGEEKMKGFVLRTLSVLHSKSGKAHRVVQLHMTNWSSDGSCSNLTSITAVIAEMSKIQRKTGNHPIVVHCSDTVSRSGMFCAIATTIERCNMEGVVDVFQVVKALRVQKPGAVCNAFQYRTLFEAVLMYLNSFDTYGNFQDL